MTDPPGTSSPIAGAPDGVRLEAAPLWRSLLYREPTPERVATLDRWLRANPGAWVRLYHSTDAALPVAHEGLKPTGGVRRNSLQSRTGYVSFSIYPGHAEVFARMAFPRRAVTIYGVDLRVGELVADRDQLRNQRAWARREVKDTLAHSLAFGRGARPQRRMEDFGANALSHTELIAMLLQGSGTAAEWAVETASRLIAEAGSIRGLSAWAATDYRRIKGIGRMKGAQLSAMGEIARRMMAGGEMRPLLNRADHIAAYFAPVVSGLAVEKFWVLCLARTNRLLKRVEITSGTATATLAHPREVFRAAIRESASAAACVHNHPSGDPTPSAADIAPVYIYPERRSCEGVWLGLFACAARNKNHPNHERTYSTKPCGLVPVFAFRLWTLRRVGASPLNSGCRCGSDESGTYSASSAATSSSSSRSSGWRCWRNFLTLPFSSSFRT